MTIDFTRLRAANVARQAEWAGNEEADLLFRTVEIADEAGELCGAIKKRARAQRGIAGATLTLGDVADEMGDTIISLDLLANQMGASLHGAADELIATRWNALEMTLVIDSVIGDLSYNMLVYLGTALEPETTRAEGEAVVLASMRLAVRWICTMADALGIDVQQAVADKFNKTSRKYGLATTMAACQAA
jgi:NTP pyrophosphatase (non-canonical NTP hydrolase)